MKSEQEINEKIRIIKETLSLTEDELGDELAIDRKLTNYLNDVLTVLAWVMK